MTQSRLMQAAIVAIAGFVAYKYGLGAGLLCGVAAVLGAWWWISVESGW